MDPSVRIKGIRFLFIAACDRDVRALYGEANVIRKLKLEILRNGLFGLNYASINSIVINQLNFLSRNISVADKTALDIGRQSRADHFHGDSHDTALIQYNLFVAFSTKQFDGQAVKICFGRKVYLQGWTMNNVYGE